MRRRIVVAVAVLAISVSGLAGCKKQPEQAAEAPANTATTPEPAATPAPGPGQTGTTGPAASATGASGETLFKQHCAACHPDGGNTINPKKTLHAADLKANNITTPEDIVKVMRNPPAGMNKFDQTVLSDQDAKAIGEYILATWK